MNKKFEFIGNRKYIRTDDEMALIDKGAADAAFKKYKKESLNPFMQAHGFVAYKTSAYIRINTIGLLEYVDLQKESYGSKTLCVNFAVMPLYYPMEYMCIGLGNRLGSYISGKDIWWDYADENISEMSFQNIKEGIQKYLFSWFENLSHEENYKKKLQNDIGMAVSYPCQEWLISIDSTEKAKVILKNAEKLKLPKKLINTYFNETSINA